MNLILGDQLFRDLSALPDAPVVMVEDAGLAGHFRYHSHKLVLTFSAMRHFSACLGERVRYFEIDQRQTVFSVLEATGAREVHTYEPADHFFAQQLRKWAGQTGIRLVEHENPMFLTSRDAWGTYARSYKRRFMAEFYRWQRLRLGLLLTECGGPVGGQWSFDPENRKPLPKKLTPPYVAPCEPDAITREVQEMVANRFPDHAGDPADFAYPVSHEEAEAWLDTFVEERLDLFGDYEDALSRRERVIYHGVLTPMLNTGLLTPDQVVRRVLDRHEQRPVPLNSLEGFIRQVVGWREFIRGVDREDRAGEDIFGHTRRLRPCWWDATTGLPPLDLSLSRAVRHGWCHHIERLMVIGAAAFMVEARPDEAYRLFMELFVDAAEWVMGPNVFGMSQFSSTASFATKPYFSGSAYLLKMSDYEKGPWCEVWDGLYWRTVRRNREFFANNPRTVQLARGYDRLEPVRRERILNAADRFVEQVTESG